MDQRGSVQYTKNTKARFFICFKKSNIFILIFKTYNLKIQVLGLLGNLSTSIAAFILDTY